MKSTKRSLSAIAIALACAFLLSACGDPSGEGTPAPKVTITIYRSHEGITDIRFDSTVIGSADVTQLETTAGDHAFSWAYVSADAHSESHGTVAMTRTVSAANPFIIIEDETTRHVGAAPRIASIDLSGNPSYVLKDDPVTFVAECSNQYGSRMPLTGVALSVDDAPIASRAYSLASIGDHHLKAACGGVSGVWTVTACEPESLALSGGDMVVKGTDDKIDFKLTVTTADSHTFSAANFTLTMDGADFSGTSYSAAGAVVGKHSFVAAKGGKNSPPLSVYAVANPSYPEYARVSISDYSLSMRTAVSPDDSLLAICSGGAKSGVDATLQASKVSLIDVDAKDVVASWTQAGATHAWKKAAFSADGERLLAFYDGTGDSTIAVFATSASSLTLVETRAMAAKVVDAAFDAGGNVLFSTNAAAYTWTPGSASAPALIASVNYGNAFFADDASYAAAALVKTNTGSAVSYLELTPLPSGPTAEYLAPDIQAAGVTSGKFSRDGEHAVFFRQGGWQTPVSSWTVATGTMDYTATWYGRDFSLGAECIVGDSAGKVYTLYHSITGNPIKSEYFDLAIAPSMYTMMDITLSADDSLLIAHNLSGQLTILKRSE